MMGIAHLNQEQFAAMLKGQSVDQALETRRQLQIALAEYARTHKMDALQDKVVTMTEKIAKWCRIVWMRQKMGFDYASAPKAVQEYNKVRFRALKAEWELYIKRRSF